MKYVIKPTEVDVIGYKKVWFADKVAGPYGNKPADEAILVLHIPKGTLVGAYTDIDRVTGLRKLRAERAYVKSAQNMLGKRIKCNKTHAFYSMNGIDYIYTLSQWMKPTYKFSRRKSECESGLHFFLALSEARAW